MAHHRRRRPRSQVASWWRRYSLIQPPYADVRMVAEPCNQERGHKRRDRKRQRQGSEDMYYECCPNPVHATERRRDKRRGLPRWRWHRAPLLSFPHGGRTDVVRCRKCGIMMPRINGLP